MADSKPGARGLFYHSGMGAFVTKRLRSIAVSVVLALSTPALASDEATGTISDLLVYANGIVFVKMSVVPTSRPACSTDTYWTFAFDETAPGGAGELASLLSAQSRAVTLKYAGTQSCAASSVIETILRQNTEIVWPVSGISVDKPKRTCA